MKKIFVILFAMVIVISMLPNVSIKASAEDYRGWSQSDARWGSLTMSSDPGATVAIFGCTSVSITKLMVQSGAVSASYTPANFVTEMNAIGGYLYGGYMQYYTINQLGYDFKYLGKVSTTSASTAIDYINSGYYVMIEGTSSIGHHFCAVDNAFTISNGYLTVMNSWYYPSDNINKKYDTVFTSISAIHYFEGPNGTPSPTPTYSTFTEGMYYIKNNYDGLYLSVNGYKDAQAQNVGTWALNFPTVNEPIEFQMNFIKTNNNGAYKLRPEICASRVVNAYGYTVSSGCNVNIYDDLGETSEWWYFEKVSGGYVIRNVMNTGCVMTVESNQNVVVQTYNGSQSQLWSVQNTVTYDANGGTGAPPVQFKNYDEALTLSPTEPTRTGYVFLGWSTSPTASYATYGSGGTFTTNANTTLYAIWAPATYIVTFKNWNGSVISTQSVNYGSAAYSPGNPYRSGYTFIGWDTAFDNVTSDIIVTAMFSVNSYTVTFKDWDGTVLKTQSVNYGSAASAPANPYRTGYTFAGWDRSFSNIGSDITVTATYSINIHTVTFKDWDGTVISTQYISYGSSASAPSNPSRTGYSFTGWDTAFSSITSDVTVTACYSANAYTITFNANGGNCTDSTMTVVYGYVYGIMPRPTKSMKSFLGWSPTNSADNIVGTYSTVLTASDHTLYAIWGDFTYIRETEHNGHKYVLYGGYSSWYTAKEFCEANGGHLATITSESEQAIIDSLNEGALNLWLGASDTNLDGTWEWVTNEPFEYTYWAKNEPSKGNNEEMYLGTIPFMWNDYFESPTGMEIYGFIMEKNTSYTVTFKDWDGSTLKTQSVNYGSAATAPASPTRTGYSFTGWDVAFNNVTSDLTVTAVYTKKNENYPTYTVTLTDKNDGTATITATIPANVATGKLVIDFSDKLTFVAGSLTSVNGAVINESYSNGNLCVSFAGINTMPVGTLVFTAEFKVNNGATLSTADFSAPEWNLTDGTVKLASDADGDVIKLYEKTSYMLGDVNGDGYIDNLDSAYVLRYDAGVITDSALNLLAADVNGDGSVDNLDAAWILKYDAGIISKF